jgi:F420-dependent methylenetetrahydromethanopterin dehydrogenase
MSVDWMWCYENPEQAAAQIELLRATLDAEREGTKTLAAERDKWFDKTQSDAKVIAEKDAKIVELEAGYEIQMRNLDAAEKAIAALRISTNLAIVRFEGCGMKYAADEIRRASTDTDEQTIGD